MSKKLQKIDFSSGIRGEGIQANFEILEDQIARERLSVAGHGISSGLDIIVDDFKIQVTEGSVIGTDGKELFLESEEGNIELPRLREVKDELFVVGSRGKITLPNVPYSINRKGVSIANAANSGITITNYNNSLEQIRIRNLQDNTITIDSSYSGGLVKVSYFYTNKRYDTVYINTDGEIKILEGTTSSSPSIMIAEDSSYVLGYLEIDPFYMKSDGSVVAILNLKEDMRNLRNIFTDKDNRLFICGIPFDDLQIINMKQPKDPYENQLWYDSYFNKLRVWKTINGVAQWIDVNDVSTVPVLETKMWTPEEIPFDGKNFIFSPEEINLHFMPNTNSLDIRIDQNILHKDQFYELSMRDAKTSPELRGLLNENGYTDEFIDNINENYENIGVGFSLGTPLDKGCYVEALVTHRVQQSPLFRRFQRSATFVASGYFTASASEKTVRLEEPYREGENQLEVFLDGRRLQLGLDYVEGELLKPIDIGGKGKSLNTFTFLIDLPEEAIVSYKITSSVYSYDHLEDVVGNLGEKLAEMADEVLEAIDVITNTKAEVNHAISEMNGEIDSIKSLGDEHRNFLRNDQPIPMSSIPMPIISGVARGIINEVVIKDSSSSIVLDSIKPDDFLIVFNMSLLSSNNILRRKKHDIASEVGDYYLERVGDTTVMRFESISALPEGSELYITGVSFSLAQQKG